MCCSHSAYLEPTPTGYPTHHAHWNWQHTYCLHTVYKWPHPTPDLLGWATHRVWFKLSPTSLDPQMWWMIVYLVCMHKVWNTVSASEPWPRRLRCRQPLFTLSCHTLLCFRIPVLCCIPPLPLIPVHTAHVLFKRWWRRVGCAFCFYTHLSN